jgi:hypothetical protein
LLLPRDHYAQGAHTLAFLSHGKLFFGMPRQSFCVEKLWMPWSCEVKVHGASVPRLRHRLFTSNQKAVGSAERSGAPRECRKRWTPRGRFAESLGVFCVRPLGERNHREHHRDAGRTWPQARGDDEGLCAAGCGPVKLIVNDPFKLDERSRETDTARRSQMGHRIGAALCATISLCLAKLAVHNVL